MTRLLKYLIFILTSFLLTESLFASGALFVRPVRSTGEYEKMSIRTFDATVAINDQVAETHVDQVFFNSMNTTVESTFIFPLPENAVITDLFYWFNGVRYQAEIKIKEEAQQAYDNNISRLIDPALLQEIGDNLFKLNIAPINARSEVRFEITYVEMLPYEFGLVEYEFFLNTTGLSPDPLQRVSVQLDAQTSNSFKSFAVPGFEGTSALSLTKKSESHYEIIFGDENYQPDANLKIEFETVRQGVEMNLQTYIPSAEDNWGTDGFYALWITPPDDITEEETIARNLVFTADISSSMEGERIKQLRQALHAFLDHLNEADKFNIVTFGTAVNKYAEDLVPATQNEIAAARMFVSGLGTFGLTAIDEALKVSLGMSFGDSTVNSITFLTDGVPTWGELRVNTIVDSATVRNKKDVRIFPFGIGKDVSKPLLITLARENGGLSTFVTENDSIALVVSNHVARVSKPVLSRLSVDFGGLLPSDNFPMVISDLFYGNQVLRLGRYDGGGKYLLSLNGDIRREPFQLKSTKAFRGETGGLRAVARLWAQSKITALLEEIEIYGDLAELKDAVIDLSLRYGILTKYTALYSDPTSVEEDKILPKDFTLMQNYPNPFNPETKIVFYIPGSATSRFVTIKIYDILGRVVRILYAQTTTPGRYELIWDGRNELGQALPSGVYVYRLMAGETVLQKKMTLVR
ncbi:VWA domain-containing protein [candidate division KSB1 bacterium]|nr:VWA domain-containing protein [candidate division KSB1 bacterium]